MRDFRDAKMMAQTLREALNAKSMSITHSESLELVAKILGFHDWNVLAAKIQSELQPSAIEPGASTRQARSPTESMQDNQSGKPAPQEVTVDAAILDSYVGFYQLNDSAVFTVTRRENHLITRLTGQGEVPIYARSNTGFFAKIVDAQISFIPDAKGQTGSLILHQGGANIPMQRIDGATAQEIAGKTAEKVKSQSASPGTEAALRRLIDGIISGKPNYDEMSSSLAEATRHQLPNLQSCLAELSAVQSVRFLGVGTQGEDVYTVRHENGASHWRIALDSKGKISTAWVTPGP
jgi:Glyoxalase superfamily protein/Domain of unknown function (DUF3471)